MEETLRRLEALCLKHNPGLGMGEIRDLINAAIRLVCYQQYLRGGKRKIMEIVELCGVENGRYRLERLFRYNPDTDRLEPTGILPSWKV